MRQLTVLMVMAAALLGWSGAAAAHATVQLTVHSDGRGSVSVDVSWTDGHPVTGAIAATMTAVSATAPRVGPVALTRLPGQATVVYGGTLPPGEWQVTVDTALPGIGHCAAVVRVGGAESRPSTSRCGTPPPSAPAAAPAGDRGARPFWIVGAVALALAVAALGYGARVLLTRRGDSA